MELLARKLKAMGVHRILVADDAPENIQAARAVAEKLWRLEDIRVDFFSSSEAIRREIDLPSGAFDLVLTDLSMEHDKSGLDVLEAAWQIFVPTAVITGGFDHGTHKLYVAGVVRGMIVGDKSDPAAWEAVLQMIADQAPLGLWGALERRRRFAPKGDGTAEMARKIAAAELHVA